LGRCRSSAVRAGARSSDIGSENRKSLRFEKPLLSAGLSNKVATSVLRSHRTDAYVHRHRLAAWRRLRRLRERASTLPWAHAYPFRVPLLMT